VKIIKTFIIGSVIIAVLVALPFLFLAIMWGNLPELMFQHFLPKEVINKNIKDIEIHNIAKIRCINRNFYFSNNAEKIAYIDNNYNLVILDIGTKKENKIYQFRDNDFNQTFSKGVFRFPQPRLLWSPDNTKILFADFPDLFIYDFVNKSISKQGEFKIRGTNSEKLFKAGWTHGAYGSIDYSWFDSITIIYLCSPVPRYSSDGPIQFLIKNIQNNESKIIDLEMPTCLDHWDLQSFRWSDQEKALIRDPEIFSIRSTSSRFYGLPQEKEEKFINIVANENLDSNYKATAFDLTVESVGLADSYRQTLTPEQYKKYLKVVKNYAIEIKDMRNSMELLDTIIYDPVFVEFTNKEGLKNLFKELLKKMLITLIYPDGTIKYQQSEGIKSPNGQKSFFISDIDRKEWLGIKGSGKIFIRDGIAQKQKEIDLKPIRIEYNQGHVWLSNKYVLFCGNEVIQNSIIYKIYKLDEYTEQLTKYPNRAYPVLWPSPENEKVIVSFRSDEFATGDATAYRYHNLALFDKNGVEVFLYKILCRFGEIINCCWDKYSKYFYFIIADYNIAPGSGDSFDKNKASKYSVHAIVLK
jgi:hypothetical protein